MRRLLLLLTVPCLMAAADHWLRFTSGPYEVYTDAGERAGRETMVRFAEFRHTISELTGEADPQTPLPIRIFVFSKPKGWESVAPVSKGRVSYNIVLDEKSQPSPALYSQLAELFLINSSARLPARFEHGLIEFLSTYTVKDLHITVGAPPSSPDLDWARIHYLATDPQFYGKLRVLMFNLRKGTAEDPAYRNAFGKSAADIEAEVKRHLAQGKFASTTVSSLPMAAKDFTPRDVSETDARLVRADILAAPSGAEYEALLKDELKSAEAEEGLGLIALRQSKPQEAKEHFAAAIKSNTNSPRCYIEYAKLEPDYAKASQALLKAAGMDGKLDEPLALLAERDTDPQRRLAHWKAAAERNPKNSMYWQKLAECYVAEHEYVEASKAYTRGAQAAPDNAARERLIQARVSIEKERLDYEDAEKKRQAEEEAAETARLKEQELAKIHALEDKYKTAPANPNEKPLAWHLGPTPTANVTGVLSQVDCLAGGQARLTVTTEDRKTVKLLIVKQEAVSVSGPGNIALGCGAQTRRVKIGYFPKANAKLATAGEAAIIEFQ